MLPVPELRPLKSRSTEGPQDQTPSLSRPSSKLSAGWPTSNVTWDPEYQQPQRNTINVEFGNTTLEEALDYVSYITKSYWKALSPNTNLHTNDNLNKRRDFADMVAKTFLLAGTSTRRRKCRKSSTPSAPYRIAARGGLPFSKRHHCARRIGPVAFAEKMLLDLDKPRAEVVVDVMVLEASTHFSRQLTSAIAAAGLTISRHLRRREPASPPPATTSGTGSSATTTYQHLHPGGEHREDRFPGFPDDPSERTLTSRTQRHQD